MITVDASVAVKWFIAEPGSAPAHALLDGSGLLIGPDLVIHETLNVLRRKSKRGEIAPDHLNLASMALVGFFDRLIAAYTLVDQTVLLSRMLDHDIYDCAYLACAIHEDAVLVTADNVFAAKAAARGLAAHITLP